MKGYIILILAPRYTSELLRKNIIKGYMYRIESQKKYEKFPLMRY